MDNQDAGSLKYMAPEILEKKKNAVTAAVDMWALGIILYTMLVGKLPFDGNHFHEVADKIINNKYVIPTQVEK